MNKLSRFVAVFLSVTFFVPHSAFALTPSYDDTVSFSGSLEDASKLVPDTLPEKEIMATVDSLDRFVEDYGSNLALAKLKLLKKKYERYFTDEYRNYFYPSSLTIRTAKSGGLDFSSNFNDRTFSESLDFMTGARAADEAFQFRSINSNGLSDPADRKIDISNLPRVEISSHPWDEMLSSLEVAEVKPIMKFAPEDHLMVYFTDADHIFLLEDSLKSISAFGDYFMDISSLLDVKKAVVERLGIENLEVLKAGVGETLFVSEDLDFVNGTNYALVFEIESESLRTLSAFLKSDKNFSEVVGNYLVISTSKDLLERMKSANANGVSSMGDAKDLIYTLSVLDDRRDGVAFFSDAFIRKMVSPEYRINAGRKAEALRQLETLQYMVFAYRSITGSWPANFTELANKKYADPIKMSTVDKNYGISPDGVVTHDEWGSIYLSTPISDVSISKITDTESEDYIDFNRDYQRYWTKYIDPIGISFAIGDQIYINTIILPLIDESSYNTAKSLTGGKSSEFTLLKESPRIPPIWFLSKLDFDNFILTLLGSLDEARGSAENAMIRVLISELRNVAEIYYVEGDSYGQPGDMCTTGKSFLTSEYGKSTIDAIQREVSPSDVKCIISAQAYAISVKAPDMDAYFCVDSSGAMQSQLTAVTKDSCGTAITSEKERELRDAFDNSNSSATSLESKKAKINEELNKEFGLEGEDKLDIFGIVGDEFQIGLGSSVSYELERISDLDAYVGVKLKDEAKAKKFIQSIYKVISSEFGGGDFGFFSIPSQAPPANEYKGIEYSILPTGFVNIYYMFNKNNFYLTVSQLAINNLIDSTRGSLESDGSVFNRRTQEYVGTSGNMALFVDLSPYKKYKEELLDKNFESNYFLSDQVYDTLGYLTDVQLLAKTGVDSQKYFPNIPDKFFGVDIKLESSDIKLTGTKSVSLAELSGGNRYYRSNLDNKSVKLKDLISADVRQKMLDDLENLKGFGIILSFTEEGLDIKMSVGNPLITKKDSRFGPASSFGSIDQKNIVTAVFAVLILIIIILAVALKIKKRRESNMVQ